MCPIARSKNYLFILTVIYVCKGQANHETPCIEADGALFFIILYIHEAYLLLVGKVIAMSTPCPKSLVRL